MHFKKFRLFCLNKAIRFLISSGLLLTLAVSYTVMPQENINDSLHSINKKRLHILLINSGNQDLPMEQEISLGLKNKLKDNSVGITVNVYQEYLDSARFNENAQRNIFSDYLKKKYSAHPIDLVISNGIPAASFFSQHPHLFQKIKHLFVRSGEVDISRVKNKIHVEASNNYKKSVNDLVRLSEPQKIVVIADSSSSLARVHLKSLKAEFKLLPSTIDIEYIIDAPLAKLQQHVSMLAAGSIVLFTPIMRSKNGGTQAPYTTLNLLVQSSRVPIFSFWGSFMGSGVVGGYMLSGEKVGESIGGIIVDIANGKDIDNYPLSFFNVHMYDWRQLQKHNINAKDLFSNAVIEYYQPSFFEKYKLGILLTILAFIVLTVFLFLLAFANKKRNSAIKALEVEQNLLEKRVFERTEELLIEKQKAEAASIAKSDFLANMSHEIRTPMNGVMGMLGLLKKTNIDEQQKHYINISECSSQSLLSVINDILDFSKIEAGKLDIEEVDFNLQLLIEESIASMTFLACEKSLDIIADTINVSEIFVKGDPNRLRQIFNNLLSNAIKFTDKGDVLVIAKTEQENDIINFTFSVSDSGIGIEKDKIDTLFTSFTQADNSTTRKYGGTGLGLSITKQLCKLMGGDVCVTSALNQGSTFTAHISLSIGEKTDNDATSINISNQKILIIDDNKINREILIAQLSHWGADAFATQGGEETLALLTGDEAPEIDAMIIDYQMPEMNGIELAKIIQKIEKYQQTKLLMLTSVMLDEGCQYYIDNGFSAYLTKPAAPTKLVKALIKILKQTDPHPSTLITEFNVEDICAVDLSNKVLLLVEDNRINQQVALAVMKHINVKSKVANNGLEALTLLESGEHIDLVLMDCQMPVMDGFEATSAIRTSEKISNAATLPIIALTANSMTGDREKCLSSGMNDYLSKPIVQEEVTLTLQKWLQS